MSLEACDEELAKPGLEPLTPDEQTQLSQYLQAVFVTKADIAEKKTRFPVLRSNATAAAQAARTAALQELDRDLEQALEFIDANNEATMLLKIRSDLRRPIVRRKMEIAAQQARLAQQAEDARARDVDQLGEVEREVNQDALIAEAPGRPEAPLEPELGVAGDGQRRQLGQQQGALRQREPEPQPIANLPVPQQPAWMTPPGQQLRRLSPSLQNPLLNPLMCQTQSYTGLQPPWSSMDRDRTTGSKTPFPTQPLNPVTLSLRHASSTEAAAKEFPIIGELLEAVGHRSFLKNQATFNAHFSRQHDDNIATAMTATKMAEDAVSPEEKAEWFKVAAEQYKAASDVNSTTTEINKLSELVPFKDALNIIKDHNQGPRHILNALASLPVNPQYILERLGNRKCVANSSDTDSNDSRQEWRKRPHQSQERQPAPAPRPDTEWNRQVYSGGKGAPYRTLGQGPCYLCNTTGHVAINCPKVEGIPSEARVAAIAAARSAWQRNIPKPNGE